MLSYMLPTGDKPPPGETHNQGYNRLSRLQNRSNNNSQLIRNGIINTTKIMQPRHTIEVNKNSGTSSMMITTTLPLKNIDNSHDNNCKKNDINNHSPKHNGTTVITTATPRKSTLHTSRVTKDDSLHSINSEASTGGNDRKSKISNGAKHANLKR